MDPPDGKELQLTGGEPDEETIMAKKRSRRVSFAETTAIHLFDRDEDYETPPGSAEAFSQQGSSGELSALRSVPSDSSDDDDSKASDDDDSEPVLLFRDIDSSSPGSVVGSVTSNDDDNFFGPISASFIRSGRLSETEASEDNNHDITLDSTAFSLHYQSVAPPDDHSVNSAGSIRTPTGETLPTIPRDVKKNEVDSSASQSHNAMSLIIDDSQRYDYGKISPALEALLAEVDRSIQPSLPNVVEESGRGEAGIGDTVMMECGNDGDHMMDISIDKNDNLNPSDNSQRSLLIDASTNEKTQDVGQTMVDAYCESDREATIYVKETTNSQNLNLLSSPYRKPPENLNFQSDNVYQNNFEGEGNSSKSYPIFSPRSTPSSQELAIKDSHQQLELESGVHTPTNAVQAFQIPLEGSVSSIHAKRQKLFLEQPPSSLEMEFRKHDEKISAIKNQITRFQTPETPRLAIFQVALSKEDNILLDPQGNSTKFTDLPNTEHVGVLVNSIENNSLNVTESPRDDQIRDLKQLGFETPKNGRHNDTNMIIDRTVNSIDTIPSFKLLESGINVNQDSLMAHKPFDGISSPNVCRSPRGQKKAEPKKNGQEGFYTPGSGEIFRSSPFFEENQVQSLTPFTIAVSNDLRSLAGQKELATNYNDSQLCNLHEKVVSSKNILPGSQDMNIEKKKDLIDERLKLSQREVFASSCEPTSGDDYKEAAIAKFVNTVQGLDKVTFEVLNTNNLILPNPTGSIPSNSTQNPRPHNYCDNNQDILSVKESFLAQDVGTVRRKRKDVQILPEENDAIKELDRAQISLKPLPKVLRDISEYHADRATEVTDIGGPTTLIQSADILVKVSEAAKELVSTSVYDITLEKIDLVENMLSKLQAARKYEWFCSALRNNEWLGSSRQKRKSEARSLQDKLLFEQVKLQLKRAKLHFLHNKAQSFQLRYRECHHLKSMLSQLICGTIASQTHETNLYSDSIHSGNKHKEVTSKKLELEMLDQKFKCLVKSMEASCQIKGNMGYDQIIQVLNQNLRTRNHCTVIRQDLQLWELSDIVKKNDCSEIVLNYCNLLCQRFTINVGHVPSIMSENSLNESNIGKNFPKMNAHLAFEFVFNAKGAQRLADSKCFQHKTLVTSLLLGTLLDVTKEVQVSQRELWNLVGSAFYSQCPGELELQLSFFNFKSFGNITLGLDMTRLGCGVYPSKSSELQLRIIPGTETTLPQSTLDEIMSSVLSLQDGRPMLLKLCRRISELVQALS